MTITVPRARQEVSSNPSPTVRMNSDAPSGAFDNGAMQVNEAAQKIFEDHRQKADMAAFYDADLRAAKIQAQLEVANKEKLKGREAMGAPDAADMAFESELADIAQSLTPSQREMFEKSAKSRRGSLYATLEHYAGSEATKYSIGVAESYINQTKADAANAANKLNVGDEVGTIGGVADITDQLQRQEAGVRDWAKLHGMDDAQTLQLVKQHRSDTHRAVIDVLLTNGNDIVAQNYRDMHKDEIIGERDITSVNKALEDGTIRGASQRNHDEIMLSNETWEERIAAANKIEDPKIRDKTIERLDATRNREKAIEIQTSNDNFVKYAYEAEKAGTTDIIPQSVRSKMTVHEITAIEQRLKHVREGTEPANDSALWTNFSFMPLAAKAKLTEADMMRKYRPRLDDQHYDAALREIQAIKDEMAKKGANGLSAMQTDADIVKNAYMRYSGKFKADDFNDDDRERYIEFSDRASVAVQKFEQEKGGKATDDEKQKIVNGILVDKVYVSGWGFDKQKAAILIKQDEQDRVYVPMANIPESGRRGLVNWARSEGIIPQNATQAEAEAFLGSRLERAYGMGHIGASDESWMEVLRDGPRMVTKAK